jgi:hypothetical protein
MIRNLFDFGFFVVMVTLAVRQWHNVKMIKRPTIVDNNMSLTFTLDRNNQLVVSAVGGVPLPVCAAKTEEVAMLLLPVARKVLEGHGVQE